MGFFRCGGTDLELVAGAAWDHQMSLVRMHLPLSCEVPCGTWRHDVLAVAQAMCEGAVLARWCRDDGSIAKAKNPWVSASEEDPAEMWWRAWCDWAGHDPSVRQCEVQCSDTELGTRLLTIRMLHPTFTSDRQLMEDAHWHRMPVVLSGGEGRCERWVVMAENVRSLTAAKWDIIRAKATAPQVTVLALIEVWDLKDEVDLDVARYICIPSAIMRTGRGIVLWVRLGRGRTKTEGHRVLLDNRHALVVAVSTAVGPLGLIAVHMPQRAETDAYKQVTKEVASVKNAHAGVRFLATEDWNRCVPCHDPSIAFSLWLGGAI